MGWCRDKETDIFTRYRFQIEGIEVNFIDSWCPGATISLYERGKLLFTRIDCPKVLRWTRAELDLLWGGGVVEIEYWEDGYMRREVLATEEEADEIALRGMYDERDVAHIAVPCTLSVGTSTVWLKIKRRRCYSSLLDLDVRFCVEFANSEECTRFLNEDIRKLEYLAIDDDIDVAVIGDIMHALVPLFGGHKSAQRNAVKRGIPFSQLEDECPQPEMQLIRHRASNRGDDRPCFLTLHLSTINIYRITGVDWTAINNSPTFPLRSDTFRSLNNIHLKFPSPASHGSSSRSHQDDLTITIAAREISFLDGSNSISAGNSFSVNSLHRTVNINYINAVMGDGYFGAISGGNVGGRGNHIRMELPSEPPSPPEHTRAQTLLLALARRRAQSRHRKPDPSVREIGRPVKARTQRPRPY